MWCVVCVGTSYWLGRERRMSQPAVPSPPSWWRETALDLPRARRYYSILYVTIDFIGYLCAFCECLQTQNAITNAMVYIPWRWKFFGSLKLYVWHVYCRLSQQQPVNAWSKLYVSSAKAVRNFDQVSLTQSYDSLHSWMSSSCLSTS